MAMYDDQQVYFAGLIDFLNDLGAVAVPGRRLCSDRPAPGQSRYRGEPC
jgi:hypothetical protein